MKWGGQKHRRARIRTRSSLLCLDAASDGAFLSIALALPSRGRGRWNELRRRVAAVLVSHEEFFCACVTYGLEVQEKLMERAAACSEGMVPISIAEYTALQCDVSFLKESFTPSRYPYKKSGCEKSPASLSNKVKGLAPEQWDFCCSWGFGSPCSQNVMKKMGTCNCSLLPCHLRGLVRYIYRAAYTGFSCQSR